MEVTKSSYKIPWDDLFVDNEYYIKNKSLYKKILNYKENNMICDDCRKNFPVSHIIQHEDLTKGKYLCWMCFYKKLEKDMIKERKLSIIDYIKLFVGKYFTSIG